MFGWLYGQGSSIRGTILTSNVTLDCYNQSTLFRHTVVCGGPTIVELNYTQQEYDSAKKKIERRLVTVSTPDGDLLLFPLRKNEFIEYTDTLIYQTIYGEQVANTFLDRVTGIQDLIKDCQTQSKMTGYVKALDGRSLFSRSPHSSLNLLLQGSAGVVAKKWMVNYHQIAYEKYKIYDPMHFKQQLFLHDEYDCIVKTEHVHKLADALEEGASKTSIDYNTNIPIKAEAKIGTCWYDCH